MDAAVIDDRNTALLSWFASTARDLPWRYSSGPYAVLVSEVMLQQTQVDRVIPKYIAFLDRWPTATSLANADTDELLLAWSGLGYNTRALRLRKAAHEVARNGWPDSVAGLEQLPGVGPYTAAAVASISLGLEVPAIDTNLKRVLSRWAGAIMTGGQLSIYAESVVAAPAGDWNQALMDLGSQICRPKNPECDDCPVNQWCTDPTVYSPPVKQASFEGSRRQLRGSLLRAHLNGENLHTAGQDLNRSHDEIDAAIGDLKREGLLSAGP